MLSPIEISRTQETPAVTLNKQEGIFEFSDTSWPEDAKKFYEPILAWFEDYFQDPNVDTIVEFRMNYFNTASAKQIAKILSLLQSNMSASDITVNWYYDPDDSDMQKAGKRFQQTLGLRINVLTSSD